AKAAAHTLHAVSRHRPGGVARCLLLHRSGPSGRRPPIRSRRQTATPRPIETRAMDEPKPRDLARQILPAEYLDLQDLINLGLRKNAVAQHVAAGRLIRLRRGRYARSELHD